MIEINVSKQTDTALRKQTETVSSIFVIYEGLYRKAICIYAVYFNLLLIGYSDKCMNCKCVFLSARKAVCSNIVYREGLFVYALNV